MLNVDVDQKDQKAIVRIGGHATIENVAMIKMRIKEIMNNNNDITITAQGLEKVDITFLQIIQSLYITCKKQNIELDLTSLFVSEVVLRCIYSNGLFDQMECVHGV